MVNGLVKILVTLGSSASIGLGIWHFFVPRIWNWYAYIDPRATELIVAVRAINIFFSLSLVLFGALNIFFAYAGHSSRPLHLALLGATCILWLTRLVLQLIYPQGSMNPALQYGMLALFILVSLSYLIPLYLLGKAGG